MSTAVSLSPPLLVSLPSPEDRTMLALPIVEETDRLLKEGKLSQRQIAEHLQISRGTVSAIARGRRALFGRALEADKMDSDPLLPAGRCPSCGFLVHMPCLICRTREYRHGRRVLAAMGAVRTHGASPSRRPPVRRRQRRCHARVA